MYLVTLNDTYITHTKIFLAQVPCRLHYLCTITRYQSKTIFGYSNLIYNYIAWLCLYLFYATAILAMFSLFSPIILHEDKYCQIASQKQAQQSWLVVFQTFPESKFKSVRAAGNVDRKSWPGISFDQRSRDVVNTLRVITANQMKRWRDSRSQSPHHHTTPPTRNTLTRV